MKRFASTRSENLDSQPAAGRAQCSVGSIDEDGMRYGLATQALIASTIATAPTIVTTQSTMIRARRGRRPVTRSSGWWNSWAGFDSSAGGEGQENGGAGGGDSGAGWSLRASLSRDKSDSCGRPSQEGGASVAGSRRSSTSLTE